jgi:hypothetical protein
MTTAEIDYRHLDAVCFLQQAHKMVEAGDLNPIAFNDALMAVDYYGYVID